MEQFIEHLVRPTALRKRIMMRAAHKGIVEELGKWPQRGFRYEVWQTRNVSKMKAHVD